MSITWNVRLYAQPDLKTCWRAALRMMLAWRQSRHISDSEWEKRSKSLCGRFGYGSARPSLADFQIDQMARNLVVQNRGLRSNVDNKLDKFMTHLTKGPVMFHLPGVPFGHMVIAISSRSIRCKSYLVEPIQPTSFMIADPCAKGYPPGPCRAGTRIIPASKVELAIARGYIWYWK